jgi:hypothetical protein
VPGDAGVVDQDVDRAGLPDQIARPGGIAEIGGSEPGVAALGGDGVDHRRAVGGVPPVHDQIRAAAGQFLGCGPADARGCTGDQCGQALEVVLFAHDGCHPRIAVANGVTEAFPGSVPRSGRAETARAAAGYAGDRVRR